jgi:hypothetical protein
MTLSKKGRCPNFTCRADFQLALSRQDGGATFKLRQHQKKSLDASKKEYGVYWTFGVGSSGIADNLCGCAKLGNEIATPDARADEKMAHVSRRLNPLSGRVRFL